MPKPIKTIKTLADLTPDSMNPNKGTDEGRRLVDHSLTNYGFGRSILVDRSANVIAGNKTLEAAINHDLPVRVIQTDGKEVIAVQRTDIDLFSTDDAERITARSLSIVDNEATMKGYERDADMLLTHEASGVDLEPIIPRNEIEALKASVTPKNVDAPIDADTSAQVGDLQFRVIVICESELQQSELLERFESEGLNCQALIS